MSNYTHNAEDVSIAIEMTAQMGAPNHYMARLVSNEMGEVLVSFSGTSISAVLDSAAHAAAKYVRDNETLYVSLRTPARTTCAATITHGWTRDRANRLSEHLLSVVK